MRRKRDELTEDLAAANPIPRSAVEKRHLDERARADLNRIVSLPADRVGARSSPTMSRTPRRRRLALTAALVVVLAASGIAAAAQLGLFSFREFPRPADVPGEPIRVGPRHVIAAGRVDELGWRLVGFESTQGICIGLEVAGEARAASTTCRIRSFEEGISLPTADYLGTGTDRTWLYGAVSRRATRVVLTLADGRRLQARVLPTPERLGLGSDLYLANVAGRISTAEDGAPPVTAAVAYDQAGVPIDEARR